MLAKSRATAFGIGLLAAAPAAVQAGQNPFVGNTVHANFTVKMTACRIGGPCAVLNQTTFNSLIYVDSHRRVFDYAGGRSGRVTTVDEPSDVNGSSQVWSLLPKRLISRSKMGKSISRITYTSNDGRTCTVSQSMSLPGFKMIFDINVKICEILAGHVER